MKASKDGTMKQTKDHSSLSKEVTPLLNNKKDRVPVILIVGMYVNSLLGPVHSQSARCQKCALPSKSTASIQCARSLPRHRRMVGEGQRLGDMPSTLRNA